MTLVQMGQRAKEAARFLSTAEAAQKNQALFAMADALGQHADQILAANEMDLAAAKETGMSESMLDRLTLTNERIFAIADGVRAVAALPDPVGESLGEVRRPNGLRISKRRVPLGVIGVIYEARPNVTADVAALCLKSSNACILRGGKEAFSSNRAIAQVMAQALESVGFPVGTVQLVEDTSRETATEMMRLNEYIDVLIPRGGAGLIQSVVKNATVPVIETGTGNCHIYVDAECDPDMAVDIVINAKTSRPSVCNAAESLLIHKNAPVAFYEKMRTAFIQKKVEVRGCPVICDLWDEALPATEADFDTEFLDYMISVKTVNNIDEAIDHINAHGTGHSECIVTENYTNAEHFLDCVDAAAVYVNASTRFTDGNEFGFGAEIGISTQKMHARGPMGLQELTTFKYIIRGNGQVR